MIPLCEQVHSVVDEVFGNNAEVVMGKLVQNIHEDVLKVLLLLPLLISIGTLQNLLSCFHTSGLYKKKKQAFFVNVHYKLENMSTVKQTLHLLAHVP